MHDCVTYRHDDRIHDSLEFAFASERGNLSAALEWHRSKDA